MPVYLDHNATTPLRPEARDAIIDAMGPALNPSSIHASGRAARQKVEDARHQLAEGLGVRHADLTFTSGGTEANNMVLTGFQHVFVSAVEHDAVLAPRPDATILPVDESGVVQLAALQESLAALPDAERKNTLVSIMAANNETGVIQPLAEIAEICAANQVALHSDMVQAAGKMPLDFTLDGLTFASFSAHKIGGPTGVGALWMRSGSQIPAFIQGGGQEQGRRAGTENTLGIIGFGAAMMAAASDHAHLAKLEAWRDEAEAELADLQGTISILGQGAPRLPNTSAIALPDKPSHIILMTLDLKGIQISSGSACSSGKVKESHVINAMGLPHLASHILRISGGWNSKHEDFQMLVKAIQSL